MALIDGTDPRSSSEIDNPPHHVCAMAIAGGIALMFASAPLAIWLVDTCFAALR